MKTVEKSWIWKLTGPFASSNYTTLGHTIYYPKGRPPSVHVIAHEEVHEKQIEREGWFKFYFLYLFCLPFFFNPWRKKWELEAYQKGTGLSVADAEDKIRGTPYGWIA